MYERFTDRARLVMELAAEIAARRGRAKIETDDVLLGMIREGQGVAGQVLKNFDVDHTRFDIAIAPRPTDRELKHTVTFRHQITSAVGQLVENAHREAHWLNHNYVGTEHLLLGLCCTQNCAAVAVLVNLDVSPGEICTETVNLLGAGLEGWKRHHPDMGFPGRD